MYIQIARIIFLMSLSIMKKILDLAEFKLGKDTVDYKYFKKQTMDYFYDGLKKTFKSLEESKISQKCECKSNLKHGYNDCSFCGGSGYKNIEN